MATARLGAAYGVRGELALISLSGETAHLLNIGDVQLRSPQGAVRAARVSGVRQNGSKTIIRLDGVETREAARALTGWEGWGARQEATPLQEDEYYLADLCGVEVFQQDRPVGVVVGVLPGGPSDLLEIRAEDGDRFFVPFLARFVPVVEVAARRIELESGYDWGTGR